MRAFTVERYGDKAGVRAGEVPDPEVGADDVLVRIHSASVNPLDRMIRDGVARQAKHSAQCQLSRFCAN